MTGYAWIAQVRPGLEAEYTRRHDEIWPELVQSIRHAGLRHYHIFRNGQDLIGSFETDGRVDHRMDSFPESEVWRRWQRHMAGLIEQRDGIPVRDQLVRVFRMPGQSMNVGD